VLIKPAENWSVRVEAETLLKKIGDAERTGRYRPTWIGLDLVRHF
jgi:hypothetical protein